jgi:lipid-binding SYLF domain-containing protein
MNFCQAGSLWDKAKSAVSDTTDMITNDETKREAEILWDKTKTAVSDTTTKVVDTAEDAISSDNNTREQDRQTIDNNAQKTLSRLFNESQKAKELYDKAAGYAVFDSREFAFMIKTGFGSGVAVNKTNHSRTYMKMASGGLNVGGGVKYIQVIFIFPTDKSLNNFITNGWNAEGDASAVGGHDSSQVGITLSDGTKIYELVDTGIMLKMSISGTKYWKDSDLN